MPLSRRCTRRVQMGAELHDAVIDLLVELEVPALDLSQSQGQNER